MIENLPIGTRDEWIELSDRCRLFARIVAPENAEREPVPAVLEYLPYRLSDGTAYSDATHHPYFAAHGYASIRVDIRGTGNSDGILHDEYLPQEQSDACEVIAWIAAQPWCTGAVGMFGKSWGGFNGLQVAARRPPALKAVVSAYSTDDRYADDVHHMGGCVLGHEALSWGSYMLGINALPPDPEIVGDRWREIWLDRLERTPFFVEEWLRHQRRDEFWRQGSICEDFGAVQAAILLVGGWADGYTNAVDRALAGLTRAGVPCRGLVGPWSHGWPEIADPGPRIGFLQECVRWWDRWLRGAANGAMDEPPLRAWMQDYAAPAAHHAFRPGRWVGEAEWPSPRTPLRRWFPRGDGGLCSEAGEPGNASIVGHAAAGADAGAWCPYGLVTDFPPDQRAEDGVALSFTSRALDRPLELLGVPVLTLRLTVDQPLALVAARLCDVGPDGASLLVARGLLNLSHRAGHTEPAPMPVGEPTVVRFALDFAGHSFAPGHRIRLSVSPTYWPFAWPSPQAVTLGVSVGGPSVIELPVRSPDAAEPPMSAFLAPESTPPPPGHVDFRPWRRHARDVATGRITLDVGAAERTRLDRDGLTFGEELSRRYEIDDGRPLSARVQCRGDHFLQRGSWRISIRVRTAMTGTAESFLITSELDAFEDGVRVFARRSDVSVPRDLV
ncbi:MAG: CocE/NonD family hydrolase [Solirubrobacteraceae bacterium]